jgi:hypothetical protein
LVWEAIPLTQGSGVLIYRTSQSIDRCYRVCLERAYTIQHRRHNTIQTSRLIV